MVADLVLKTVVGQGLSIIDSRTVYQPGSEIFCKYYGLKPGEIDILDRIK